MSDLLNFASEVQSAIGFTENALMAASEITLDITTGEHGEWKELDAACDTLGKALALLKTALDPLKDAIAQERKRQDEMEDRQDAQSY